MDNSYQTSSFISFSSPNNSAEHIQQSPNGFGFQPRKFSSPKINNRYRFYQNTSPQYQQSHRSPPGQYWNGPNQYNNGPNQYNNGSNQYNNGPSPYRNNHKWRRNSSFNNSANSSNNSFNKSQDGRDNNIENYLHPSFLEDPWARLDRSDNKIAENSLNSSSSQIFN